MHCTDAKPLLARLADGDSSLGMDAREELLSHVAACAACHAAVEEQRDVAAWLRGRPASVPRPGLVARVSARIDAERPQAGLDGWLGLANWRRWTAALVPLAAALLVAAFVDLSSTSSSTTANGVAPTLDEWTVAGAPAMLQPSVTGEALIEAVLTGTLPSAGEPNVR